MMRRVALVGLVLVALSVFACTSPEAQKYEESRARWCLTNDTYVKMMQAQDHLDGAFLGWNSECIRLYEDEFGTPPP